MPVPMPTPVAVANMLTDLIGRDVKAQSAAPAAAAAKKQFVAVYRDADDGLRALACCDLAVGGSFASALTIVPVSRVDDAVKQGSLDDDLLANLNEVFNVLSAIFPKAGQKRLILRSMQMDGALDPDVQALLAKPPQRLDMDVSVAGYRSGRLMIAAQ
jgi:hypothetical protein